MYNCCTIYEKDFNVVYVFIIFVTSSMKTITNTFEGMSDQPAPQWIEPKVSNYLINRCLQ